MVAVNASGFRTDEAEAELDTREDEVVAAAGAELTLIMLSRAHFVNSCSIELGIAVPKFLSIGLFSCRYTTTVIGYQASSGNPYARANHVRLFLLRVSTSEQ
jgi:hypothetical protein